MIAIKDSIPSAQKSVNPPEVETWLALAKEGEEDASRALLDFLYPQVISIVRARLPKRGSAEDLCQDIFIRVFQKLEQYSGKVPLKHWVSRIAVNLCTNAYHKSKSCQELRLADLGEDEARVIESLSASEDELEPSQSWAARELVDKLMAVLKPNDRLLVELICLKGFTYHQAHEETGWNVSAMKVRMFRIRKRLEKVLTRLTREQALPVIPFPRHLCPFDQPAPLAGYGT